MAMSKKELERLGKIEERVDSGFNYIDKQLAEIKNNHLLHITKDIGELRAKQIELSSEINTMAVKMAAIIAGIVILIEVGIRFLFN